jgi:uncharacterized GH25 family protein
MFDGFLNGETLMRTMLLGGMAFLFTVYVLPAVDTKATRPLTIVVLDAETNQPISGATVSLRANGYYRKTNAVDAAGRFTLQVPEKDEYVSVACRKDGYTTTAVAWQAEDEPAETPAECVVKMPRGKRIGGQVVDEAGKPVGGAKVVLYYWPMTEPLNNAAAGTKAYVSPRIPWEQLTTDGAGRWSYGGADPKATQIEVHVDHKDFVRKDNDRSLGIAELFDQTAKTVLERGVDLSGTVASATDGSPIKDVRVTTVETYYVVNDYGVKTKTDAQGKFTLAHLRPGQVSVTVMSKGFAPDFQTVNAKADSPPMSFKLQPGKTIRGKVVDPDGNPVAGVSMRLQQWRGKASLPLSAESDAEGRFTLTDAPTDEMEFQIGKRGYQYRFDQKIKARDDGEEVVVTVKPESKGL